MKKYITLNFIICVFLSVLVVVGAAFFLFTQTLVAEKTESLKTTAKTVNIAKIPDGTDLRQFAEEIAKTSQSLRVTIIGADGTVLADSEKAGSEHENHLGRQEIADALTYGDGEAARISHTTNLYTVYAAQKLDDGNILRLAYPVGSIYSFLLTMVLVVIAVLAVVMLFVYAFSRRFSKKLLSPLNEINTLLETRTEVAQDIKVKPFDEVAPMLANIEFLIAKLNKDLAEIKRTERMRSDFVANASHELKSPLTSIKGFAELMSNGLITDEAQKKEYLNRIVNESDRLLNIINDILHLSEAESGEIDRSNFESIKLAELTGEIFKALEPLAAQKNIKLLCENNATLSCKRKELWEIIYNLADNAIRYGNNGGFVKVTLAETDKSVSIAVEDNGIGIADEHKGRVFERFYRVDKSRSRKSGGTGLGLSIVRNVAVKYGGSVLLESQEGKGTKITVTFAKQQGK